MTTTVTATPQPDATPPRIRLDITTDQTSLTVYRVAADGSTVAVRTYDGGPLTVTGGSTFLYDPEAPQGEPVSYTTDDPATTGSATVTVDSGQVWLTHPNAPSRSVPVRVSAVSDRTAPANQSVRYPLGRQFPIVANDGQRKAPAYTLTVLTSGDGDAAALEALLNDLSTLLLNVPASRGWVGMGTEYVSVGDLAVSNPGRVVTSVNRLWDLPCTVTDRPSGGSMAFNTYGTSKTLYATYAARKAAHATYGAAFDS